MPVKIERKTDVCDGCHRSDVGVIRFRKELGINKCLCSKCCHRALGDYNKICCKCNKKNDDGSFEMPRYNGKDMCPDCIEKEELKRKRREARILTIKNFLQNHWKWYIPIIIGSIIGITSIVIDL